MENLKQTANFSGPKGPVVLLIMDGIGIGKYSEGDLVLSANTPNLDWLRANTPSGVLKAHGTAVGLPSDDDMGNSEVGHNAIGCGRVFEQGAALVNQAIASRSLFDGEVWKRLISNVKTNGSTLHLLGLLSDGNVHSHVDHLEALLSEAKKTGVKRARVHILLDGRDVPPTSALLYVDRLEGFLHSMSSDDGVDYRIASGGGRMKVTMDRYQADWNIVALGWKTHVAGDGPSFGSAREAIETARSKTPGIIDQDLPPFVISEGGRPVGSIKDGDSVVLFNFRGDRSIEISRAFEERDFHEFRREPNPEIHFAAMMQYDGDLLIPKNFLVSPPAIDRTMGEYLAHAGVKQLAISETQKFGHVTYFFNGNRSGKFDQDLETYVEVPSDRVPFEERPWMKAAEITDKVVEAIVQNDFRFIRLNFPNGDMVGHTGVFPAVTIAVETVDLCLGRIMKAVRESEGILVVSADHGNADDMYIRGKKEGEIEYDARTKLPKPKTAHSLNRVPVSVYDPSGAANIRISKQPDLGISSLAATCLNLLGFESPSGYTPSVITIARR
ncbi:MAG: 2,3-bisphosphoglycerate-independent phosphoglycerate mutase [Spirochaetales bacterium]|nr:2,3-bisphosphoglycerate-independent phosphoglycerate mutase [Spirochaetales bacterium]